MKLSIVTTLFRSEAYVDEFCRRMIASADGLTRDFEIILVNDGSPDDALRIAIGISKSDRRVRVVDLSRNFGHHQAIMTGLGFAQGEWVFLIDVDLEEQPEDLPRYWEALSRETDADVVFGVQESRKGGLVKRLGGWAFYGFFNALSDLKLPRNLITSRLMSRRFVDAVLEFRERELTLAGLFVATGFRQVPLVVSKLSRKATSYSLAHRMSLFVTAITSFSNKPLTMVFYLGCAMVCASSTFVAYLVGRRLLTDEVMSGWTSLIVSVWLVGGVAVFSIGLIGIYLSRMFIEVKNRPYAIVRRVYGAAD